MIQRELGRSVAKDPILYPYRIGRVGERKLARATRLGLSCLLTFAVVLGGDSAVFGEALWGCWETPDGRVCAMRGPGDNSNGPTDPKQESNEQASPTEPVVPSTTYSPIPTQTSPMPASSPESTGPTNNASATQPGNSVQQDEAGRKESNSKKKSKSKKRSAKKKKGKTRGSPKTQSPDRGNKGPRQGSEPRPPEIGPPGGAGNQANPPSSVAGGECKLVQDCPACRERGCGMPCSYRWEPAGCSSGNPECNWLKEHRHSWTCSDLKKKCELIETCVSPAPAGFDKAECLEKARRSSACKAEQCDADCQVRSFDPEKGGFVEGVLQSCKQCCVEAQNLDAICLDSYDKCLLPATNEEQITECKMRLDSCRRSAAERTQKLGCNYPYSGADDTSFGGAGGAPGGPPGMTF